MPRIDVRRTVALLLLLLTLAPALSWAGHAGRSRERNLKGNSCPRCGPS